MASQRKRSNIYGWSSIEELAKDIYVDPFRDLLEGNLVFACRSFNNSSSIKLLVITKTTRGFRLGSLYQGWSCYYPLVPTEFILGVIKDDLQKNKTEKYIIEDFIDCIKFYDEN